MSKKRVLTNDEVVQIRIAYNSGYSQRQLANKYGVGKSVIQNIVVNKTYKDIHYETETILRTIDADNFTSEVALVAIYGEVRLKYDDEIKQVLLLDYDPNDSFSLVRFIPLRQFMDTAWRIERGYPEVIERLREI